MNFSLTATKRDSGSPQALRESGSIPAVLYGPEIDPVSISFDYNTFDKLYSEAGESTMIDVVVDGAEPVKSLIQDIQYDPVKDTITHVDLRQIKMGEEMSAVIALEFEGEPAAVKELGGTLSRSVREVNVRCLPKDLVSNIVVDLTVLKTFDDAISIGDLVLPEGIKVTDEPTTLVAKVAAPLTEEQLKAMEETQEASVADVEVDGEKKEGDDAAEGDEKEKKEDAPAEKKE